MFKKTEKPATCEMCSVMDIHSQLCEMRGEHAISDSMVRRWVRHFNEGRENVHDDLRSGQPSVVN
jgi:transposase